MSKSKRSEIVWFESNKFFDYLDTKEDWARLQFAYPKLSREDLLKAKEATYNGTRTLEERDARPNYGFRIEHDGERTLGEFLTSKGKIGITHGMVAMKRGPRRT